MWFRCVAVVVVAAVWCRGVVGAEEGVVEDDPIGCGPAVALLMEKRVVGESHLSRLPGGDGGNSTGSEVCGGGACCVPEVTNALLAAGKRSLRKVVSSTADKLLKELTTQRHRFSSAVEEALTGSENRTEKVLKTRYPRVAEEARPLLQQLYAGLRAGLTEADERVVKQSLATFWDDLFPPVYHSVLHSLPLPFTERYSQCLKEARRVVRPWGPIPTLVGEPLLRGINSARLLLHALDTGSHVLLSARNLSVSPECSEAVARMELCGACHGAVVPPCSGMCLNVARGCLAALAEVQDGWHDLSGSVMRVKESLHVVRIAHLLHQLPDKVSEAIMLAMEHGPRLLKKVRKNCSSPMYVEQEEGEGQPQHAALPAEEDAERQEQDENLKEELEREERASRRILESVAGAAGAVDAARFWWTTLPETHCRNLHAHDKNCWNGVRVAPYTKTAAGVGIHAQKYNPEVRLERPDTSVYSLIEKLRAVRRLVVTSLTWLLKSDSRRTHHGQMDGSGSGVDVPGMEMSAESHNRGGSPSDDDEYEYYHNYYDDSFSGYGSGDQLPNEPSVPKGVPVPAHETTASSGQLRASLLMVMLMAVAGAALQR
ncbi:hypothetical protein O3P69_006792 [Scylla paramamosain]|uniref:Glypican-5-like n=1 Tax=Scylla paramamosain TaxID=85552 RepID=A0AAW0U346_SCYPA